MPIRDWLFHGWLNDWRHAPILAGSVVLVGVSVGLMGAFLWFFLTPMVYANTAAMKEIMPVVDSINARTLEERMDTKQRLWCQAADLERLSDYRRDLNELQEEYANATGVTYRLLRCDEIPSLQ